ncbi:MAG: S8 family serine peptidase, partial [Halococcoides sp.]
MKRSIALVVAALMVCSVIVVPVTATADEPTEKLSPPDRQQASDRPDPRDPIDRAPIDDGIDRSGTVEVIVRFDERSPPDRSATTASALQSHASDTQAAFDRFAAARDGVTIERDFWIANAKLVRVDTDRVSLDALAGVTHVREIHENERVSVSSTDTVQSPPPRGAPEPSTGMDLGPSVEGKTNASPSATLSNGENGTYGLDMINASEAWETYDQRGENASVAVLDSGINTTAHPDLAPDSWAEFDASGSQLETKPNDGDGHGTHVSGTVVGNTTDAGEHYGVAPDATLLHGKVMNDEGAGSFASIVAGMEWAVTHDPTPDVISMSLGTSQERRYLEPVRNARDAGVVVVAASGNFGQGYADDPGAVYDALSVGAVNSSGDVWSYSSGKTVDTSERWGAYAPADWPEDYTVPDVTAPGVDVYSAAPDGGYQTMNGTSMATPHVAGVAALIRSEHQDISEAGVR